ncbi:MAG: DUF3883 domain-containing protein [Bacteroidota bacterium]
MSLDWTREEVIFIVADYFAMFEKELTNQNYNKSEHRRTLSNFLNDRENAIEFKHQNISGVLAQMGLPFIKGYKPLFHKQQLLEDEVILFLNAAKSIFEKEFLKFANDKAEQISKEIDFEKIVAKSPTKSKATYKEPSFLPIKTNYLAKEQDNRLLGEKGEQLVFDYEKWRLIKAGKDSLASKIEWVSKDKGDGLGYDILSRNNNGTDKFIEVKTTKLAKETPFYLSRNELAFASTKGKEFYLYRVFNFKENPQFFIKQGTYESFCQLKPESYIGFF